MFPFIERSVQIKQNVVEQDFIEQNIRKTLNFGHTIGHALESLFLLKGKPIMHGEAVALGMICETKISFLQDLISEETSNEIVSNIQKYYPRLDITAFSVEEIVNLMKQKNYSVDENSFKKNKPLYVLEKVEELYGF